MVATTLKVLLGLTLVLAVACGGAPAATPPAADGAPTAAPTPVIASDTASPTAAPQTAVPPAQPELNPGKLTIVVGDFGPERFDGTFLGGNPGGHNYGRILQGYLISTNETMEMVPGLASKWGFSADGLTWTFTLGQGGKFHDGSEVTLEDVFWSLQHTFGPQAVEYGASTAARLSRALDKIELSGPDEVSLTTREPLTELGFFVAESGPYWYTVMPRRATPHDPDAELAYDNNPIGAGFMRLVNHVPAYSMSFERFDDFYYQPKNGFPEDKRVNFETMDMLLVPEEATRVSALRAGEADIVPASIGAKQQVEAGGGRLLMGQEGIIINLKLEGCYETQYPCHDKRVRQALDYAIDKELIRDRLYGGPEVFQVKGWNAITPSTIGYTPGLDPRPFDPEQARQLLADAGYPGGVGFGKLIVNTWPSTAMPQQVEAAQLGADFWRKELGLDVEIRVGDSTGMQQLERTGGMNGQIYWRDNDTRKDPTSLIGGSFGDPEYPTRAHEDPELLQLVQETVQILDPDERAEAYKELALRLRDESYWLGIGYANIPWGVGPRVSTWQPYPLAQFPSALHTVTLK
ncbi:MAG TPA: ABC transporter substrate-binding protein [Dehalococcoidia bacterium]|nr:ABC transporter substrate-binding protein [Dehalococcoidia bacterium]